MKKDLSYYLDLEYTVRLKENEDGSFFAEIEELPGCFTEAETQSEALAMIEDAKQSWLEVALDRRLSIPEPASDDFSGRLNVRLPKYIHRSLAYKAKQEGVSLNTLISTTLSASVR